MIINDISFFNFRNLTDNKISFNKSKNVLCGENAQGKTNIIEAIWLFTGFKSFRGSKDSEFIKKGEEKAKTEISFKNNSDIQTAKIIFENKKTIFLNEKRISSAAALNEKIKAVIFSPSDVNLVTDIPQKRRRSLDTAIGQIYPKYIDISKNYLRAVTQRNSVLKDLKYDSSLKIMLDVFEKEICENGEKIIKYRLRYLELLKEFLPDIYSDLSGGEQLKLSYLCSVKNNFKEELKNSLNEDILRGITSIGPHRDDIAFYINGMNSHSFASQGQKRSISLSLKLAEAEVIKKTTSQMPIILLDDVLSELDKGRQNYILNNIVDGQVFITCCDKSNFENLEGGKVFTVKNGDIF